jgi:hypothetical protein
MNIVIRTVLSLGLVALIAAPAAAQGRGGFGRGSYSNLLGNASVQKELNLDDKQVEKAKELADKINAERQEKMQDLQGLEGQERFTKAAEITRELNASTVKAAGDFLKPEQITRLKQIHYQQQAAQAFTDHEVAAKLKLTDAQKSDIQAIQQESAQEMRTIFQENQGDREAAMKAMNELRKKTLAKVEAKLNDEQQKTWKELLGAPFEVKYEPRNN